MPTKKEGEKYLEGHIKRIAALLGMTPKEAEELKEGAQRMKKWIKNEIDSCINFIFPKKAKEEAARRTAEEERRKAAFWEEYRRERAAIAKEETMD
ncbi:hypothetical protein [Candidatus Cardinium hertigii]|uniref:Uncharacterized protein n=1 Tax=Candidatus Cardinium hertigii TaxID=247481 RepID=A0A2Z3LH69_9BACT|nr:hypothetical protein [Candidatus Cardinium hertigii]AWN81774.1 hypothetical protein DK880_00448 [Candidatus Cardinium hertigii]